MANFIEGRESVIEYLRRELVGPVEIGDPLACEPNGAVVFDDVSDLFKNWHQEGSEQEILQRDNPCHRYGVGVLYPSGITNEEMETEIVHQEVESENEEVSTIFQGAEDELNKIRTRAGGDIEEDSDDFDISSSNRVMPSSMGISFLLKMDKKSKLVVEVPLYMEASDGMQFAVNGRYSKVNARAGDLDRLWWLRVPVAIEVEFTYNDLYFSENGFATGTVNKSNDLGPLDLRIEVFSRKIKGREDCRLLTVSLVNRTVKKADPIDPERCLFQSFVRAKVIDDNKKSTILPYPGPSAEKMDEEERSLALLYREYETFAVGHGCAANWGGLINDDTIVTWVSGECLPIHEVPSVTPDIKKSDGTRLEVSMRELAGLVEGETGFNSLHEVTEEYLGWISEQKRLIDTLPENLQGSARMHMDKCETAATRMREGLSILQNTDCEDSKAILEAFKLANHAMYLQQTRSSREIRHLIWNEESKYFGIEKPLSLELSRGKWRAFQIAFILMSLKSVADGNDPFRENVELIWFPTGGGKTEAYLGLAAFSIFLRRLRDKDDAGVDVIMRYTLRLLTSQQFQRACGLTCAMDYLRHQNIESLGEHPISIGLWLGSSFTPNTRDAAKEALNKLMRDNRAENPFVLRKCPWCSAEMGTIKAVQKLRRGRGRRNMQLPAVLGYKESAGTVILHCTDRECHFHKKLPIHVIDEDIYDFKPDILLGTVDKFAVLTWNSKTRGIFGIDELGNRVNAPPTLIIQDELHLISGPLGSIVGLFELLIEELCTDNRLERRILPKIICSTATIRRYTEQVTALYRRESVELFPPPGLNSSDSFFSRTAIDESGVPLPGKKFVGVCALGFTSAQTSQVRTIGALLQAPMNLPMAERDPWWTNLNFFNSIRELGGSISLLQSDIPDYLKGMCNRYNADYKNRRELKEFKELTSRLREDEIPKTIEELEVKYGSRQKPIDFCLASNIIEVGVDIDRLSLMTVFGQPKSTSQYIQVTGRVGRRWWERPGLVVTIFYPNRPRDKSHFEKFHSFHQRLYAQVEPTSVTPYSEPVLERVLHGIMVAYVRQMGNPDVQMSPYPYPQDLIEQFRIVVENSTQHLDKSAKDELMRTFDKRASEWKGWERTLWDSSKTEGDIPLLHRAGSYVEQRWELYSWPTMSSMRNVDSSSKLEISNSYLGRGEFDAL